MQQELLRQPASTTSRRQRLNVGCGRSPTPGWRNFDSSFSLVLSRHPVLAAALHRAGLLDRMQYEYVQFCRRSGIERANAARRLPVATGTADVVYTCHMFEHLDRDDARRFLAEAHRALCPGGVLRIAVPNIQHMIDEYARTGDADRLLHDSMLGKRRARTVRERIALALFGDPGHKWMYDARSMVRLLTEAGFAEAAAVPPGVTSIADPDMLDLREREGETLYVEARRP